MVNFTVSKPERVVIVLILLRLAAIAWQQSGYDVDYRRGVRDVKNQLILNHDIFGSYEPQEVNNTHFRNALSAVVDVICDEWGGSGVIFDDEGLVLTNYHVIEGNDECDIGFTRNVSDYPIYTHIGTVEYFEDTLDVAVLRITEAYEGYAMPVKFPTLNLGSSDALNIGDAIYMIGYPTYGESTITLTNGIMSGRVGDDYIKFSAKIDAGNSGGAALNGKGQYIGIPTFSVIGEDVEELGYILGIDSVKEWLEQFMLTEHNNH